MNCRHCGYKLIQTFIDLGSAPASNAYLTETTMRAAEKWYPLHVLVCGNCRLVQTEDFANADELFSADYAYFSSYSSSWLKHAEDYVAEMTRRFGPNSSSRVIEVAANDGYLLQFVAAAGIPCFGIEPTASTASAARAKGIQVIEDFFGTRLAEELVQSGQQADLIVANNVLAHVPDINDFTSGFRILLKPGGVATFEFHHLLQLIKETQFDTIYHEHYCYLSLTALEKVFNSNGLKIFDVEELPTHGGSLRVYAQRSDSGKQKLQSSVPVLLKKEKDFGLADDAAYSGFQSRVEQIKNDLVTFLIEKKRKNQKVVGYGAAAKGNTILNYAGIRPDLLPWVVDLNPAKQGKYLPGSRIPVVGEEQIRKEQPGFILILPWNLKEEISDQLSYVREWGGKFVVAIPRLHVF